MKVVGALGALGVAVLLVLMTVRVPEPASTTRSAARAPWRVADELTDGLGTKFVVMDEARAKDRSAYDAAVATPSGSSRRAGSPAIRSSQCGGATATPAR